MPILQGVRGPEIFSLARDSSAAPFSENVPFEPDALPLNDMPEHSGCRTQRR